MFSVLCIVLRILRILGLDEGEDAGDDADDPPCEYFK